MINQVHDKSSPFSGMKLKPGSASFVWQQIWDLSWLKPSFIDHSGKQRQCGIYPQQAVRAHTHLLQLFWLQWFRLWETLGSVAAGFVRTYPVLQVGENKRPSGWFAGWRWCVRWACWAAWSRKRSELSSCRHFTNT